MPDILSSQIWVQTVYKDHQQTTKAKHFGRVNGDILSVLNKDTFWVLTRSTSQLNSIKIHFGYSLEVPHSLTSNECPKETKKNGLVIIVLSAYSEFIARMQNLL